MPAREPPSDPHQVAIQDVGPLASDFSLDEHGFSVVTLSSGIGSFYDDDNTVHERYYPQVEQLVCKTTNAQSVICFDHNVRSAQVQEQRGPQSREPAGYVHNDYTEASAPRRLRDLLGVEADDVLEKRRYAFINVWRPLRGPVQDKPLAVCEAGSMREEDFVATDLVYPDRTGEIYSVRFSERHQWWFVADMQPPQALLLKCFDSQHEGIARFTAHSAFDNLERPTETLPRLSIEARTIAVY